MCINMNKITLPKYKLLGFETHRKTSFIIGVVLNLFLTKDEVLLLKFALLLILIIFLNFAQFQYNTFGDSAGQFLH